METGPVSGGTSSAKRAERAVPAGSRPAARNRPAPEASAPPGGADAPHGPCDVVTVPTRQGLEAVDILRRGPAPLVGPVLHDGDGDTLGFLVPPGTAAAWDVPGSACTRTTGDGPRTPDARTEPPVSGTGWLLPPTDTRPVTDPALLREALGEAARLIEVADNCR